MSKQRVGGYCLRYGERNLNDGVYTSATDFGPLRRVLALFHHGLALCPELAEYSNVVLGAARLRFVPDGIRVKLELDPSDEFHAALVDLVDRGLLGWSTGATFTTNGDNGYLARAVLYEVSLTPAPAGRNCRAFLL